MLECGNVFINEIVASDTAIPGGGVKDSGYGRECYSDGLHETLNRKAIIVGAGKWLIFKLIERKIYYLYYHSLVLPLCFLQFNLLFLESLLDVPSPVFPLILPPVLSILLDRTCSLYLRSGFLRLLLFWGSCGLFVGRSCLSLLFVLSSCNFHILEHLWLHHGDQFLLEVKRLRCFHHRGNFTLRVGSFHDDIKFVSAIAALLPLWL